MDIAVIITILILMLAIFLTFILVGKMIIAKSANTSLNIEERKFIHDYNNTLLCIEGLLNNGKIEECKEYIAKINTSTRSFKSHIHTGNSFIDILINDKYQDAVKNDIAMITKLSDLSDIPLSNFDIVNILSNLLDNSIEACKKLKYKDKKIFIKIKNTVDDFTLTISNPIEEEIFVENFILKSSKQSDGLPHGIGMTTIRDTAKKYNAKILIRSENGFFYYIINIKKKIENN